MPRIYKLSRAGLKLLYKVRHHRGHGIHSPFVFSLIQKVIEEKAPYYAYGDLKDFLCSSPNIAVPTSKYNKLSFRLVNYFSAKKILEIGSEYGINSLYLTAPAQDICCLCIETDVNKAAIARNIYEDWDRSIQLSDINILPRINEKQDCIFIDLDVCESFTKEMLPLVLSLWHDNTFIVVKGIRTNRSNYMLWKDIAGIEDRTAMLDLFNIGIVFFNKKLYRWDYQISF